MSGEFGTDGMFGGHGAGFNPALHAPSTKGGFLGEPATSFELAAGNVPRATDDSNAPEGLQPDLDNSNRREVSLLRLLAAAVPVEALSRIDDGAETFPYDRPVEPATNPGSDATGLQFPQDDGDWTDVIPVVKYGPPESGDPTVVLEPVAPPSDLPTEVLEPPVRPAAEATQRFVPVPLPLLAGSPFDSLASQGFQLIGGRHDQLGPDSFSPDAQPVDMFAKWAPPQL